MFDEHKDFLIDFNNKPERWIKTFKDSSFYWVDLNKNQNETALLEIYETIYNMDSNTMFTLLTYNLNEAYKVLLKRKL